MRRILFDWIILKVNHVAWIAFRLHPSYVFNVPAGQNSLLSRSKLAGREAVLVRVAQ